MDESLYNSLKALVLALAMVFLGWVLYNSFFGGDRGPAYYDYQSADKAFSDTNYERALRDYHSALEQDLEMPVQARRGIARSLMQLGRHEEALAAFDRAIEMEQDFAGSYANRGILYDRMGEHELALRDYRKALRLDPKLADGPGWLTRFLRNQTEAPPTIADRAEYLRTELAKPEDERLLRVPEIDERQRSYKQ